MRSLSDAQMGSLQQLFFDNSGPTMLNISLYDAGVNLNVSKKYSTSSFNMSGTYMGNNKCLIKWHVNYYILSILPRFS